MELKWAFLVSISLFIVTHDDTVLAQSGLSCFELCGKHSSCSGGLIDPASVVCFCQDGFVSVYGNGTDCVAYIPDESSASALSTGAVAAISVLAVLSFVMLYVVILYCCLSRRDAHTSRRMIESISTMLSSVHQSGFARPRVPRELRRTQVQARDILGEGHFGQVCSGVLRENPLSPGHLVAIKSLSPRLTANSTSFIMEAVLMAQLDSPFVLKLIGVITTGSPLMVVLELCEHGSLDHYLKHHETDELDKVRFAGDIAEGLQYLSSKNVVHRDLAARNVLVSGERRCKISDFGMSRVAADFYSKRSGQIPVRWTAPEALEQHKYSSKSDCWSFGIVLYEIWTRASTPYADMKTNARVSVAVLDGYRLSKPEDCPSPVYALMLECWQVDPQNRPLFEVLVAQLRTMECNACTRSDTLLYFNPLAGLSWDEDNEPTEISP